MALVRRPESYLWLLFAVAPWPGLYVAMIWNLDAFKLGLLLAPLVLLLRLPHHETRLFRVLAALLGYALILAAWQVITHEVVEFDVLKHLDIQVRLAAANYLFLCRLLLVFLVCSVARTQTALRSCIHAYVGSAAVLGLYGLIQEGSFLAQGNPITFMHDKGILGDANRIATADIFGVTFLRIYSFCMEPKDLALFMAPAIAFVSTTLSVGARDFGRRSFQWVLLTVLCAAALLTFSTSLLIVAPLMLLGIELAGPRSNSSRAVRRFAVIAALLLIASPVLEEMWKVRVDQRLSSGETTILQKSREAPALEFLVDHLPRSLVGYGVGTQAFYLPSYMPAEFREMANSSDVVVGMDSFWFSLLLDLGIPGVLLVGMACLQCLGRGSKRHDSSWPYRAAFLATVVMSIPQQGDLRSGILWLFMGLAYQARSMVRAQTIQAHPLLIRGDRTLAVCGAPTEARAWQDIAAPPRR
ncbi:MAG: O-antigen ligase family protein [Bryobacteraceae bacterium]